ncbi:hypothetical protein LBMAG21_01630 [Armatimonadota bacterium]|nr:hypothetical protein LBMAG21_01630 [Armatimonadota bacterium]
MRSNRFTGTLLLLGTLSLVFMGCNKGETSSDSSSSGSKQSASAAGGGAGGGDGASIFSAKCAGCHKLGSKGGGNAPELTHIGGEKDAASLAEFVKNPKSKNPGSRMPAFEGKISDADMKTLTEYLASQK